MGVQLGLMGVQLGGKVFGWDTEALDPAVITMLHTWGRIAKVPYPGPELCLLRMVCAR